MGPKATAVLITVLGGVIAALRLDFGAFVKARQEDSTTKFDVALCLARAFEGALWGAGTGLGVSMAVPMGGE